MTTFAPFRKAPALGSVPAYPRRMASPRLGYMPALDGLRAVAILLVVIYHARPQVEFGRLGVDVFFVLSGFLITTLIAENIRDETFSRRRFYARRAIRLVPALLVTVLVFTPIGMALVPGGHTLLGAGLALTYLTPLLSTTIFGHTWSLAIEEWFYLVWPLVLAKMFRDRLTLRQAAALLGAAGMAIQSAAIIHPNLYLVRPSALMVGCAVALWWLSGGRVSRPTTALVSGLTMIGSAVVFGVWMWQPLPFWLVTFGTALAVAALVSGANDGVVGAMGFGPVVAVGVVSYEWYLVHYPMIQIGYKVGDGHLNLWLIPASLVAAFALHYALVPLQSRLRSRLDRPLSIAA